MLLKGKTAIVTGASRGIGQAIALTLAKEGASLVINGTKTEYLQQVAAEVQKQGGQALPVTGDVSDPETGRRLVETALKHFHRLDILVNNAGINKRVPTLQMDITEDWQRIIEVNLTGALYCCLAALPQMKKQGYGKIVNIASLAAKRPHRNAFPSYGASKAALLYLTRHFAREMAPFGINVNALCPGAIKTDMTDEWDDDYRASVLNEIPMRRLGTPEEMAQAVLFMVSPMSDYMTGEALNVNGGSYMD